MLVTLAVRLLRYCQRMTAAFPGTCRETIASNLRAYRARRRISQRDVAQQMQALGFTAWQGPTVSLAENGQRRVTAEELMGLARVLETFPAHLLSTSLLP
jgi:transcriptional regulator with XRE-family HTH domain